MKIEFTKQAAKDYEKIKSQGALFQNALKLLKVLRDNPYQTPPSYEKLSGELQGAYSRRINKQHRLVYQVNEIENKVIVLRMWTHYE